MLSLKSGAALIVTLIVAVLAYIVASQFQSNANLLVILPSVFSVITTLTLYLISIAIQNKSESAPGTSAASTQSKSSSSANESGIATLYVGNLAYKANEKLVQEYFETVGTVKSVRLVKDKKTGRRKGFGFVEVSQSDESTFINKMNETEFMERSIIVRPANEKQH